MTKALLFFNIRNVVQKALQKCEIIQFFPEKNTKAIELGTKANSNMSTLTFRACKKHTQKKVANLPSRSGMGVQRGAGCGKKKMSKTN